MFGAFDTSPDDLWLPTWGTGILGGADLPPGVDTAAAIYVQIPAAWDSCTVSPSLIGSVGNLRLHLVTSIVYQGAIYATATQDDTITAGITSYPFAGTITTPQPDTHAGRLFVSISRLGSDAADTSPNSALLLGLLLTRT